MGDERLTPRCERQPGLIVRMFVHLRSALDVSQQQKWRLREQELKLQVAQLETALQADLVDKNQILDKIQVERGESQDGQAVEETVGTSGCPAE